MIFPMKTKTVIITIVSAFCLLPSAFGQGALTPPGAPVPTMKTLDQIEPRTPISSLPFTITVPGSYYVTSNLTASSGGILIATNNVTLDLDGSALSFIQMSGGGGGDGPSIKPEGGP